MNAVTRLSSRGQVVIPKDVRDALGWPEGLELRVVRSGTRAILEPSQPTREQITYEEFRRRVPKYAGPPVAIEDMKSRIGDLFREWEV